MRSERRGHVFCGITVALVCLIFAGCGQAPQLGSEENLKAADALWTAVTSKRVELLDKVAADIESMRAENSLSAECYAELEPVIQEAKAGRWEPAAKRLRGFIEAQTRDAAPASGGA